MMKLSIMTPFLALAAAVASPALAQSQNGLDNRASCNLRIEGAPTSWIIKGYDPFTAPDPIGTFDLTFVNDGRSACVIYPTLELDTDLFGLAPDAVVGVSNRLDYSIEEVFSGVDLTPRSGRTVARANRRPITIPPGQQEMARFRLAVDDTKVVKDGLYSQIVRLVATDNRGDAAAQRSVTVGLEVMPSAVMSLSGAFTRDGSRAIVDLGELTPGLTALPLQLQVKSTRAYKVDFSSENSGRLVLKGTDWAVPYSLVVGDRALALSSGGQSIQSAYTGSLNGGQMPIRFMIGEVVAKRAGQYRDVISITVTPM